jgi:predicted SprT family Zn-dependent metalloprotease
MDIEFTQIQKLIRKPHEVKCFYHKQENNTILYQCHPGENAITKIRCNTHIQPG